MIHFFDEITDDMTSTVGGKGHNLGECARAGFPVPPGFVVPTDSYRLATSTIAKDLANAVEAGNAALARKLVGSTRFTDDFVAEVRSAYIKLGEPPVAVRSSATAEDLADASFAGQQDTYLGVQGVDNVLDAIRRCWASLWTDRAIDYRRTQNVSSEGLALAVVVQEMVEPDMAGVLFTRNPLSGSDEMMVNSSYGLGESVVAALVTPDTFTLARAPFAVTGREIGTKATRIDSVQGGGTRTTEVSADDRARPSLDDAQLRELADLGARVEDHYGHGQDLEWAYAAGVLYLLQARPITTGGVREEGHAPTSGRVARALRDDLIEHYPAPYPLDLWAVLRIQSVVQDLIRSLGMTVPAAEEVITGDDDGVIRIVASPPRPTFRLFKGLPRTFRAGMRHDPWAWPMEREALQERLGRLRTWTSGAAGASDADLLGMVDAALQAAADTTADRFLNYLSPMMALRGEASFLLRCARSSSVSVEDLYEGLDYVTAQVTSSLSTLVSEARRAGLADVITGAPAGEVSARLRASEGGAAFVDRILQFLDLWGARTTRMYLPFSNRSWREDPESLYALLAVALRGGELGEQRQQTAVESVRQRLPKPLQERWLKIVARLRAMHVGREGTLYMIEEFFCVARRATDEMARRLVEKGAIAHADDMVYLYPGEVRAALTGTGGNDLHAAIDRRRRRRGAAEALWWDRGVATADGDVVRGVPGSSGRAVGTSRIVQGPQDFPRLQPGDVLVCPYTDPTWTPLFGIARAVVADTGGPLSHAAIVAREYGIPAVLGTQNGTSLLTDGVTILVDGTAGTATVDSTESL